MINIVCLKWGDKYGAEYVNRLYGMVSRNTTQAFRFWCFTEDAQGIRDEVLVRPLPRADQFDGWWNKLWLFSEELPIRPGQTVFYIDLDTVIVGNIDQLLTAPNQPMIVLRDLLHGIARTATEVGSGLMSWQHGHCLNVWHRFLMNPAAAQQQAHPHGDQWWVQHCVTDRQYWQDVAPGQVVSFKVHCRDGIPPGARVICYHGRPSIPESATEPGTFRGQTYEAQPWILEHWRD